VRRLVAFTLAVLALPASTTACGDDRASDQVVVSADGPFARALVGRVAGGVDGVELAPMSTGATGTDVVVVAGPAVAGGGEALVVDLLAELAPIPFGQSPPYVEAPSPAEEGPALGEPDPAFWFDPDRVAQAAVLVGEAVTAAGYEGAEVATRVQALQAELAAADEQVQAILGPVPDEQRTVVTESRHLGYFAERYGLNLVPGPGLALDDAPPDTPAAIAAAVIGLAVAVAEGLSGVEP
jgi:zinc/manganese transport system substrate-binding protein